MAWHSSSVAAIASWVNWAPDSPDQHRDRQPDPPDPGQPAQILAQHRPDRGGQKQGHDDELEQLQHHLGAGHEPRLAQVDLPGPGHQLDDVTHQPGRRRRQGCGEGVQHGSGGGVRQ